nr:hypothetical protein [Streptomyces iakyrus]
MRRRTDTLSLLLAVLVTAASVQDTVAGTELLDQVAGIDMENAARKPGTRGFTPYPSGGRWSGRTAG